MRMSLDSIFLFNGQLYISRASTFLERSVHILYWLCILQAGASQKDFERAPYDIYAEKLKLSLMGVGDQQLE